MFCIGAAPTLPGIEDKFSNPMIFLSIVKFTNSCQFTEEPTEIVLSVLLKLIFIKSGFRTIPS